jgi:hypothetical protein
MARLPLVCPIDGTSLGASNANVAATIAGDPTDEHVHIKAPFQLTCQNGHVWRADVDIKLIRVS